MEQNNLQPLLESVRTVGVVKPRFDPLKKAFEPPRLEIFGTGFWLKDGVFITCEHVVQKIQNMPIDLAGMLVVGGNRKPYRKASISVVDSVHDLAVLIIEPENEEDQDVLNQEIEKGLELNANSISVGEKIAYAGYPMGNLLLNEVHSPTYAEGVIGSEIIEGGLGPKTIQISGPVIGGYSGAPIVRKDNPMKVVSVVSHSPSQEAGQASIFRGVHWKHIDALVKLMSS